MDRCGAIAVMPVCLSVCARLMQFVRIAGTRDYSAMLAVPAAVDFANQFGGVSAVMEANHAKVMAAAQRLALIWGTELATPPDLCGSMACVRLPVVRSPLALLSYAVLTLAHLQKLAHVTTPDAALALRSRLRAVHRVETVVFVWGARSPWHDWCPLTQHLSGQPPQPFIRLSAQLYNGNNDYERLAKAMMAEAEASAAI